MYENSEFMPKKPKRRIDPPVIWHNRPTNISNLYPEILSIIFSYLNVRDKGCVAQVCTSWRDAAYHKSVWRGIEAKLHLKKPNPALFLSLVKRGIKRVQILSLQKSLKEVAHGIPNIEKFTLTGCYNLNDEKLISTFNCELASLTELNISMCKQITDKSIVKIAQHLKNLEMLDLGGCGNITNNSLLAIEHGLVKLRFLNLRSCRNVTDSGIAKLTGQYSEESSSAKRRENVLLVHRREHKGKRRLEYLGLQDCQKLTDDALKFISQGLTCLKSINLSFCAGLSDLGLKHLSTMTDLKEINLRSCDNITDVGIRYLSEGSLKLEVLDVSFCDKITDQSLIYISQGLSYITKLGLNSCSISDEGLIRISQSLVELQTLYIGQCNKLTDEGLNSVAECCQNLSTIDLYGCTGITKDALSKLLELPHLTLMNLGLWQNLNPDKNNLNQEEQKDISHSQSHYIHHQNLHQSHQHYQIVQQPQNHEPQFLQHYLHHQNLHQRNQHFQILQQPQNLEPQSPQHYLYHQSLHQRHQQYLHYHHHN